jgi:hypothetical protein
VACPYCAILLDPPPARSRRCPRCRQPIVVRRVGGRPVYLAETLLAVFEKERRRSVDEQIWASDRKRWLRLAGSVRVPVARRSRLAAAPISASVAEAARALYLSGAEHAVRSARREKRWAEVARIRREQATALYHASGSSIPPPDDVLALYREGMLADLRSLAVLSRDAEVGSAGCCVACREDDGKAFRIAAELRAARLPHPGCPKGICGCDWLPTFSRPPRPRRRQSAATVARSAASRGVERVESDS